MNIYLAPMEGLTGYVYRNAYNEVFGDADKYFTPFIANRKLSAREKKDVAPDNNVGMRTVPQILTNKAPEFLNITAKLQFLGYETVNLNLGCPSMTVVTKNRGAGFLSVPDELRRFLDEIFDKTPVKISIKTRLGMHSEDEWEAILELYNEYPLEELIVHPRLQEDFYNNGLRMNCFDRVWEHCPHKICYNGDICTPEDYERIVSRYEGIHAVMIGRGILANPGLVREIKGGSPMTKDEFFKMHDLVFEGYASSLPGPHPTLCKMKELWFYMGRNFEDEKKLCKKIRKCESFERYKAVLEEYRDAYIGPVI